MALKRLLLVDDDDAFRMTLSRELGRRGFQITTAGTATDAVAKAVETAPHLILLDFRLPDHDGLWTLRTLRDRGVTAEVVMLTGHGTIDSAIEAIRLGAFDYTIKPCPVDELEVRLQRAYEHQTLEERTSVLERGLQLADQGPSVVGSTPAFLELRRTVDQLAPTDSTVLILGETGAGKEAIAKLIHSRSDRADRPFVIVECATLQEDLLQNELFGHEKGAFTGADRAKPGLFEVAHGGTIFLDEIGEVSPATQVKILRVLDTGMFRRVGGTEERRVDARILAATNRDIPALVQRGLFREDLYYRISTFTLKLPPLRERKEDIEALVEHAVARFNRRFSRDVRVGVAAMEVLRRYAWPGNVRELIHTIERATIVCEGAEILPAHLPCTIVEHKPEPPNPGRSGSNGDPAPLRLMTLEEAERAHIKAVLEAVGGRRKEAAAILGLSERSLYRKLEGLAEPGAGPGGASEPPSS